MKAFVIGGQERAALAVTRSLGRAGVDVRVGGVGNTLAGASRFARSRVDLPDPISQPERFAEVLLAEAAREPDRVWYPITDEILDIVNSLRDRLASVHLPLPPSEVLEVAWDKWLLIEAAARAGIHAPESHLPRDAGELEALIPRLRFPVILKPRRSKLRVGDRIEVGKVRVIGGPQELREAWSASHAHIPNPIIQEFVQGFGLGIFILADRGRVLARFAHRRLREKPPWGGVSVLRESIAVPEALVEPADRLMADLRWHGICMIEFRVEQGSGRPLLMEINPRFWGSLQLAVDSGVDFPRLLHRLAEGAAVNPVETYRIGVRSRWLLGDLDHLLILLKHHKGQPELPPELRSRFRAVLRFCNPLAGNLEISNFSDLGPALFELRGYLANFF